MTLRVANERRGGKPPRPQSGLLERSDVSGRYYIELLVSQTPASCI